MFKRTRGDSKFAKLGYTKLNDDEALIKYQKPGSFNNIYKIIEMTRYTVGYDFDTSISIKGYFINGCQIKLSDECSLTVDEIKAVLAKLSDAHW